MPPLNKINRFDFLREAPCVFCEVQSKSMYIHFSLPVLRFKLIVFAGHVECLCLWTRGQNLVDKPVLNNIEE
jgi:hypothetical protein